MKTYHLIKIITDGGRLVDAYDVFNNDWRQLYFGYEKYDTKELAMEYLNSFIAENLDEYHPYEFTIVECYK